MISLKLGDEDDFRFNNRMDLIMRDESAKVNDQGWSSYLNDSGSTQEQTLSGNRRASESADPK